MPHSIPHQQIPGWGADLHRASAPHIAIPSSSPEYQEQNVAVYKSIERPQMTPVFGSTYPPKGLSGKVRKLAFKYSEGNTAHWMLLLFADRINVAEGIWEDISNGYVPNVFAEMGWGAKLKYNSRTTLKTVGMITGLFALVALLGSKKRKTKKSV